jgi:molybdate transport system substrate-binding protein
MFRLVTVLAAALTVSHVVSAAEIKLLTAGAFEQVVKELVPNFERQSGNKVTIERGTAGELKARIERGDDFDVAVITPVVLDALASEGKVVPTSRTNVATVGVGIGVKDGASKPDVSTVDAFKRALLAAKAVAYIDPASGGTSGMYIDKLLERLGIADAIRPKAKLKKGGHAAEFVASGEADIVLQQMSEIIPVKGVVAVGPLPPEIQNTTTYAAAISSASKSPDVAQALLKALSGPAAAALLKAKGMEPAAH